MKNVSYLRKNEWILLFVGIAVSALYIIFATPIYDILYPGSAEFSNEMYNNNMYLVIAVFVTSLVWAVAILYYWIIDRWSSFVAWAISLIIVMFLAPAVSFVYPNGEFSEMNIYLESDLTNFAIVNLLVTGVLYFIISLCIKGMSRNCATTPF